MNTDYKSLEQRYGTLLATKIFEEIVRADQRRFSFYQLPPCLQALQQRMQEEAEGIESFLMTKNNRAA